MDNMWGFCALGLFSCRFLGKDAVLKLSRCWKVSYTFHFHASEWINIWFASEHDRDQVVFPGHYSIFGCQLHIQTVPFILIRCPRDEYWDQFW